MAYPLNGELVYEFDELEKRLREVCELVIQTRDLLLSKTDWQEFLERPIGDDTDLPVIVSRPTDSELLKMTEDMQAATDSLATLWGNLYQHHMVPDYSGGRFKDGVRFDPSAIRAQRRRQAKPRRAAAH